MNQTPAAARYLTDFSKRKWVARDGRRYIVAFMSTSHMFYILRCLYNEAAEAYGWPMMETTSRTILLASNGDRYLAEMMAGFVAEIIARKDLPLDLVEQFTAMMSVLGYEDLKLF